MSEVVHNEDAGLLLLVKHVIKWRMPIAIVTGLAIVAAVVLTMPSIYPPKFKSTGTFYPASSVSVSKSVLAEDHSGRQDALKFGEEEEAEQLMQILESDVITNTIIAKYDLMNRYRIGNGDATDLNRMYFSNVKFNRNEHMAIEVSVLDEDPKIAAKMCADIMELMDSVKTNIVMQRAGQALQIVSDAYFAKQKEITLLEKQLAKFGEMGIINYEEQAAALSEALDKAKGDYYHALGKNNGNENAAAVVAMKARLVDVQSDYDNLAQNGGAWLSVKEGLVLELEQFKLLKEKFEQAQVDVSTKLTYKYVTNYPTAADRKSKPVRSLILLASSLAAFILSALFFILYETFMKHKTWLLAKD